MWGQAAGESLADYQAKLARNCECGNRPGYKAIEFEDAPPSPQTQIPSSMSIITTPRTASFTKLHATNATKLGT